MELLHQTSFGIGVLGVGVILLGVVHGISHFIRAELTMARGGDAETLRRELRHVLGYYLLLGLEFLIAADIIDTLMKPEPKELISLGSIVVIRTVISWSLNAELGDGRKPGSGSSPSARS